MLHVFAVAWVVKEGKPFVFVSLEVFIIVTKALLAL